MSEDLLGVPEGKDFELVEGRLVEQSVSALSTWSAGEILLLDRLFLRDRPLGLVCKADQGFQRLPYEPEGLRGPYVSFLRQARVTAGLMRQGCRRIARDLVDEVASRNESAYEMKRNSPTMLNPQALGSGSSTRIRRPFTPIGLTTQRID